jgi:hypothetical protein
MYRELVLYIQILFNDDNAYAILTTPVMISFHGEACELNVKYEVPIIFYIWSKIGFFYTKKYKRILRKQF